MVLSLRGQIKYLHFYLHQRSSSSATRKTPIFPVLNQKKKCLYDIHPISSVIKLTTRKKFRPPLSTPKKKRCFPFLFLPWQLRYHQKKHTTSWSTIKNLLWCSDNRTFVITGRWQLVKSNKTSWLPLSSNLPSKNKRNVYVTQELVKHAHHSQHHTLFYFSRCEQEEFYVLPFSVSFFFQEKSHRI